MHSQGTHLTGNAGITYGGNPEDTDALDALVPTSDMQKSSTRNMLEVKSPGRYTTNLTTNIEEDSTVGYSRAGNFGDSQAPREYGRVDDDEVHGPPKNTMSKSRTLFIVGLLILLTCGIVVGLTFGLKKSPRTADSDTSSNPATQKIYNPGFEPTPLPSPESTTLQPISELLRSTPAPVSGQTRADQIYNRLVDFARDASVLNANANTAQRKSYEYIVYNGLEWEPTDPNLDILFAVLSLLHGLNAVEDPNKDEKTWMVPGVKLCNYAGIVCHLPNSANETVNQETSNNDEYQTNISSEMYVERTRIKELNWYDMNFSGSIVDEIYLLHQYLEVLDLGKNNIQGSLPESLFELTRLKELELGANKLDGSLSSQIGMLTNLDMLALYENMFSASLPSEIGLLTRLQNAFLDSCGLVGTIPSEIGNLKNIKEFQVYNNFLTGKIPTELGKTPLRKIRFYSNNLEGTIPTEIGLMKNLDALYVDDNELTGTIPIQIQNTSLLNDIRLYNNRLTGTLFNLAKLPNLRIFYIDHNFLTGAIPTSIFNNITDIQLQKNQFTGSIPESIANSKLLRTVNLANNKLNSTIPKIIGNAKNLEKLILYGNSLEGTLPDELAFCSELEMLELHDNRLRGTISGLIGSLSKLKNLTLSDNGFTGTIPHLFKNLEILKHLSLEGNLLTGDVSPDICEIGIDTFIVDCDIECDCCTGCSEVDLLLDELGRYVDTSP